MGLFDRIKKSLFGKKDEDGEEKKEEQPKQEEEEKQEQGSEETADAEERAHPLAGVQGALGQDQVQDGLSRRIRLGRACRQVRQVDEGRVLPDCRIPEVHLRQGAGRGDRGRCRHQGRRRRPEGVHVF